nr:uncharacterized protein LOC124808311 [Hydra vulgaris]
MDKANKLKDLENRSRRNNLRIDGLHETPGENWDDCEKAVKVMIKKQLKITSEVVIERAHRIGQHKHNKPRTIVLKLLNFQDKNKILNAVKHLKGTGLYVNEDFAPETTELRRKLWEEVKKLRSEGIPIVQENNFSNVDATLDAVKVANYLEQLQNGTEENNATRSSLQSNTSILEAELFVIISFHI